MAKTRDTLFCADDLHLAAGSTEPGPPSRWRDWCGSGGVSATTTDPWSLHAGRQCFYPLDHSVCGSCGHVLVPLNPSLVPGTSCCFASG